MGPSSHSHVMVSQEIFPPRKLELFLVVVIPECFNNMIAVKGTTFLWFDFWNINVLWYKLASWGIQWSLRMSSRGRGRPRSISLHWFTFQFSQMSLPYILILRTTISAPASLKVSAVHISLWVVLCFFVCLFLSFFFFFLKILWKLLNKRFDLKMKVRGKIFGLSLKISPLHFSS